MTEQSLFNLGFKKEVDSDEPHSSKEYISYVLNKPSDFIDCISVFQEEEYGPGWYVTINDGFERECTLNGLLELLNTISRIGLLLPIIKK